MISANLGDLILQGNRRALSRGITLVENQSSKGEEIMKKIYSKTGKAHIIGFTGPPGSGKSMLVDKVIGEYRNQGMAIGVIATDSSSPFTGGALLGDRIRMLRYTGDEGVFIRSMSSRGHLGGLSSSTFSCIALMDAFGFDKIIVETVGAGQSEVDIIQNCDTTVVLSVPGLGDDIQISKAGIMEIADIFVVNKSDLLGAENLVSQIKSMLELIQSPQKWKPPVLLTDAINGNGIPNFVDKVEEHWKYLNNSNEIEKLRKKRLLGEIKLRLNEIITNKININGEKSLLEKSVNQILVNKISPNEAVSILLKELLVNFDLKDES